jgi:hypothetical protein
MNNQIEIFTFNKLQLLSFGYLEEKKYALCVLGEYVKKRY